MTFHGRSHGRNVNYFTIRLYFFVSFFYLKTFLRLRLGNRKCSCKVGVQGADVFVFYLEQDRRRTGPDETARGPVGREPAGDGRATAHDGGERGQRPGGTGDVPTEVHGAGEAEVGSAAPYVGGGQLPDHRQGEELAPREGPRAAVRHSRPGGRDQAAAGQDRAVRGHGRALQSKTQQSSLIGPNLPTV